MKLFVAILRPPVPGTPHSARRAERGIMLLEAIVYVALLAVVLALALGAFYTGLENNRNLTRNADDITRTLKAGERWRADVRLVTGAPEIGANATATNVTLSLPRGNDAVKYALRDGVMFRRGLGETNETPLLAGVARSEFVRDPRTNATAWRWEVELAGRQKVARVRPLFTFQAVESTEEKR